MNFKSIGIPTIKLLVNFFDNCSCYYNTSVPDK